MHNLESTPRITFDSNGVCSACSFAAYKRTSIDREQREKELVELCNRYRKGNGEYDVIVPCRGGKDGSFVAHQRTYFVDNKGQLTPCFPGKSQLRSQDLPTAAAINGALYLIRTDVLKSSACFTPLGTRAVMCTHAHENIDIDTESDWLAAERLISALPQLK